MASPLDEVEKTIRRPTTSGISPQTNRGLIELGEHPTITKLPVAAPVAPAIAPGPGNVKGKPSGQVMQEFSGKTPEQMKAEQAARNKALLEQHRRLAVPQ